MAKRAAKKTQRASVCKPSPTEILSPYSRHMINNPSWCTKLSESVSFSCSTEGCVIKMKCDHRFLHLVRNHGLKESHYDPDEDGHLRLADVIK